MSRIPLNYNPTWKLILPVVALLAITVVSISIYLPMAMRAGANEAAVRSDLQVAEQIKLIRDYYAQSVVAKAKQTGVLRPVIDHRNDPFGIPLPATFVQDISDLLADTNTSVKLVSPYPWPNRATRTMDSFEKDAWDQFQFDPKTTFVRSDAGKKGRYLRVAVADVMGETCVACHNSDPKSPKRDWKAGDVRGVMEVTSLAEPYMSQADRRSWFIVTSIQALAGLAILTLLATTLQILRRTREKQLAVERLAFLAHHDEMTGALKRGAFIEKLRCYCEVSNNRSLAIHFLDIDCFKEINDTLGHAAGDAIIRETARRLSNAIKPNDLVSRVGGDEFIVAQLAPSGEDEVTTLAEAIVAIMCVPFEVSGQNVQVSASIGSAMVTEGGSDTIEATLRDADTALYHAKANGRNGFKVFDTAMRHALAMRQEIEGLLQRAIADDLLRLYFQPICDAKTRGVKGYEALLRLADGKGNLVPPAAFIPMAEENGLISDIGAWVIEEACKFASTLPAKMRVSVNLSPKQFEKRSSKGSVSEIISCALQRYNLASHRVELEVTENLLLRRTPSVEIELEKLARIGVTLAMDDFGTGYSSLSYLWLLPFKKVKIDRSFVIAWANGEPSIGPILQAIISLCSALKFEITAEGIETDEQAVYFTEIGCHFLQGYLFSPPHPADQISGRCHINQM